MKTRSEILEWMDKEWDSLKWKESKAKLSALIGELVDGVPCERRIDKDCEYEEGINGQCEYIHKGEELRGLKKAIRKHLVMDCW